MSKNRYQIKNFSLDPEELLLQESIFHNANGYIGVRGNFEEGYPENDTSIRGSYINGFYDFTAMNQAERLCGLIEEKQTILNVVDTQSIQLKIDGEPFSMFEGTVEESERFLDMDGGITGRHIVWTSKSGKQLELMVKRMTSFVHLPLFLIDYSIRALNFSGTVQLVSTHNGEVENYCNPDDPRVADKSERHLLPNGILFEKDISYIHTKTVKSNLEVCTAVYHKLSKECRTAEQKTGHSVEKTFTFSINKGETVNLLKYTIFEDSIRNQDCTREAKRLMSEIIGLPAAKLYSEQQEYLTKYWKQSELEIDGDEDLNSAVHYNLYQLLQSVGKDQYCNIAAKGLSGEGYEGHYFWDTEMYILPYFILTNPEIAKNLISYRHTILGEAKQNAKLLGHKKGALYPWRTIMGKECSGYFPSGTAAYHINGDVAYSVVAYYLATKDFAFMKEKGIEILLETARLWMDVGTYYKGQFRINEVTGPDEYTCMVNNNYFTNAVAKYNLYWAYKLIELLKSTGEYEEFASKFHVTPEEAAAFKEASEKMYLPYDETLDINPQDDSFLEKKVWDFKNTPVANYPLLLHYHPLHLYRHQVCKQADTVLAHFILEDMQSFSTMRHSFEYYENITTHDSSLSTAIFSIMASKLGLEEKAYEYFGDSAKLDLFNTHHNTKDGIHTANMGGNYMAIVYGFGGLRIKEEGLFLAPSLPMPWNRYTFKICYKGSYVKISVSKEGCQITLVSGNPITIHCYNKEYRLKNVLTIKNNYKAIIFDLDGVICSTDKYHYQAWKEVADELGIYFDEKINNRLRGVSRMESFNIILENHDVRLTDKEKVYYTTKKNDIYIRLLEKMSSADLSEEVKTTLDALREKGKLLAIGSSSKNAKRILTQLGLKDYFDAISDGNNITFSKPNPEVFLKASEFVSINPNDCLVVEDAEAGLQAATAANMDCAAIGDAKKSALGTYRLETFSDLLKIVK